MESNTSANAFEVVGFFNPAGLYRTTEYIKKLLIERHAIRAALENPGGSIITAGPARAADADEVPSYSSVVGNDYHLDLLSAEQEVNKLPLQDRIELLAWCDGLTPKQAAQWANIKSGSVRSTSSAATRKRTNKSLEKLVESKTHAV